ncbi:MAG: Ger(x)C family spore germination protein [Sporomusaceae bacterium]|nr:Ger(x)C family spore germination protein [Sporomusaceae bacterium]
MGKKCLVALLIIWSSFLLTGCNGSQEMDQLAYVLVIGLDKGEGEKINVTYQIAIPRAIAGQGGSSGKRTMNMTFSVLSIAEARNLLNSTVALSPVISHVKAIVFGEELARSGIANTLGPLMRYREYRGSAFVVVTRGKAQNFIEKNSPPVTLSPAKYFEMMMQESDDTGLYAKSTLHNFYLRLKQGHEASYAVLGGVNETKDSKSKMEPKPLPGRKEQVHVSGTLPRQGGNPIEFAGLAVFHGDKMVGILDSNETRIVNMLLGNFRQGFISLADPFSPEQQISLRLRVDDRPQIKARLDDGKAVIQIHQKVDAVISSNASGIHYESKEYQGVLEQAASQFLTEDAQRLLAKTQVYGCDVIGLEQYITPFLSSYQEYQSFNWSDRYKEADIQVDMTVKIRRTGLLWQTTPLQGKE